MDSKIKDQINVKTTIKTKSQKQNEINFPVEYKILRSEVENKAGGIYSGNGEIEIIINIKK